MFTAIFVILMLSVFGRLLGIAIRTAWGLSKVLVTFIFLPVILIGLAIAGIYYIAIPVLVIAGIVMLVKRLVA